MNAEYLAGLEAPTLPHLVFRAFQGVADFPAIAEVVNASQAADHPEETTTAEQIANEYPHAPEGSDPCADGLLKQGRTLEL